MARWIKPNTNFDFVGRSKFFVTLSGLIVLGSLLMLPINHFVRGQALNFGTDFKGGSEIQVEFSRELQPAEVRGALDKAGFKGAEVVKLAGGAHPNSYLLRLAEVSAFGEAEQQRVRQSIDQEFKAGSLTRFDYKAGGDKIFLYFKSGVTVEPGQLEKVFQRAKIDTQQIQRFGRVGNTYEVALLGLDRDIRKAFDNTLGAGTVKDVPQVESVGAKMGQQLRNDGIKSVLYTLILMLVYIAFRFEFQYAPGAVVALIHDVIITVGVFAITWREFTLNIIAALLTIAGYSINDTIVVYDRIRENNAKLRERKFPVIVNTAINETLSRTLLTSLTTLFTSTAVWLIGTGSLKDFAFALTFGIFVGTYSSIFIASPLTIMLMDLVSKRKKLAVARA